MKTDYYKTDENISFYINKDSGTLYFDKVNFHYDFTETELKFMKKCIDEILEEPVTMCETGRVTHDHMFLYSLDVLKDRTYNLNIADLAYERAVGYIKEAGIPTNGSFEIDICGEYLKMVYRWLE